MTIATGYKAFTGKLARVPNDNIILIVRPNGDQHIFMERLVCTMVGQSIPEFVEDVTTKNAWMMDLFPSDPVTPEELATLVEVTA